MIAKCSRCKRESLIAHVKKMLCNSCRTSLNEHERRKQGLITEAQREKNRIRSREYYKKNKEKHKLHMKNYLKIQKNKKKHTSRGTSSYIREKILEYYNYQCKLCSSKKNLQIHHQEYGKTNKQVLKNLAKIVFVFCMKCHRKFHRLENNQNRKI